jgi:phosphoribosyl 1,2-cyclic phosphodiesterase
MKLTVVASGSSGNCYVLEGRTAALIIECGVPPEKLMAKTTLQMSKVVGCLISHEHGDHAAYAERYADLGLQLYASKLTGIAIRQAVRPVGAGALWTLGGGFGLFAFKTKHDAVEPLGFIITHDELGRLLFITDSAAIPFNFARWKVDHIMVEANYDDLIVNQRIVNGDLSLAQASRVSRTHLSIRGAVELVRANETSNLKTVTLLHLSADSADPEAFKKKMQDAVVFADVDVARPGLVRELSPQNIVL